MATELTKFLRCVWMLQCSGDSLFLTQKAGRQASLSGGLVKATADALDLSLEVRVAL